MTGARSWVGLAAILTVAAGSPAVADQLVTRAGQALETRGDWEVRGKLVVFRLPDGTLASLRLEQVDLEASEERKRDAAERTLRPREDSPPWSEPAKATVSITDQDVRRVREVGREPEPESDGEVPEATPSGGVQVVEWSQEPEGETGVAVRGVIQNLGSSFASRLSVNALFYDEAGDLVAAREVQLDDSPLAPQARREFSASLPDTLIYQEIRFLVVGRGFRPVGQGVRVGSQPVFGERP